MRVIAGKAKGHKLKSVPGKGVRPITDRAKSALFSILGAAVIDSRFLDLFAGTGGVGIEALSRGAAEAVFVEKSRRALHTLRENLALTKLSSGGRVVGADVFDYLAGEPELFDYIYVAPPQYQGLWATTLEAIDARPSWLYTDSWVIVQIHPSEYEDLSLDILSEFDQRTYGGVRLCFYRPKLPEETPAG